MIGAVEGRYVDRHEANRIRVNGAGSDALELRTRCNAVQVVQPVLKSFTAWITA